jgi:hypothetical protein
MMKEEKSHKAAKAQRIAKDSLIKQEAFGCFLFNLLTFQLFNHISSGQKRTFPVKSAKSGQNGHGGFELTWIFKILQ